MLLCIKFYIIFDKNDYFLVKHNIYIINEVTAKDAIEALRRRVDFFSKDKDNTSIIEKSYLELGI